jgi:galactokinase
MTTPTLSQERLITQVSAAFKLHFDNVPSCIVQAPGRVNLIGEHTDYNDGFVLPCAINYATIIACKRRDDAFVRILAMDIGMDFDSFLLNEPISYRADKPWANYVRGMIVELKKLGIEFGGMDLVITGDVPRGAGLSSSASLEVAIGQAVKSLFALKALTTMQIALAAQRAENNFVGCKCGIMDQLVSAQGQAGKALLIDCRSFETQQIALGETAVLIAHSRVARGLVESAYNLRRLQCEAAAAYFGCKALRDVTIAQVRSAKGLDEVTLRRARHVVSENQRTIDAAAALTAGDLASMGKLMAASHESMRNDFEITVPAIDNLVHILQESIGDAGGARMTGGGFGGCVVAVMPQERVAEASAAVNAHYRSPNGEPALIYACIASAGASALSY